MTQFITPNTRGHYPPGYPRYSSPVTSHSSLAVGDDGQRLDQATDSPDLTIFKAALEEAQSNANDYYNRNLTARDWWYARWPGQTIDGRAYSDSGAAGPLRWDGCSDTRVRTVEKVIGQHRTLITFGIRNMKVQAKSNRPFAPISQEMGAGSWQMGGAGSALTPNSQLPASSQGRESQQATTLLNWMLFTHMGAELHRELRLAVSWRNGYGASVLHNGWLQQRQLNYINLNVPGLEEFINEPAVREFMNGPTAIPIGENLSILDLQDMIMDPAYADDLAVLLRAMSHDYLTIREARAKLDDLRQLRNVDIPIPTVFVSRPQITALRPMIDIIFPAHADDLQRCWNARIELVSEVELRDRIETAHYDAKFVEEVLDHRGPSSEWQMRTAAERSNITGYGNNAYEDSIELIHFESLVHDRGVPIRFHTVFHRDLDTWALHEPSGYWHGEACYHPMRFEIAERPIISSRGIAEIAYTWEQEEKRLADAIIDRTDVSLSPPMVTTYDQLLKMKMAYQPKAIIPMRKFDEAQFMKPPPFDPVAAMIIEKVEARVREHFGIYGNDLDPQFKGMRSEEIVDDFLAEFKPVPQQMLKNCRQYLPDDEVAAVVGTLSRPFRLDRSTLNNEYEISATVDLRNRDQEWVDSKLQRFMQIAQLDTQGIIDKTVLLRAAIESTDYSLAESAIPDNTQVVTQAEIQQEQQAIDLIIGSGQDQPLPQGANYQLRLQTLQAKVQGLQQNPATLRILQQNPDIMKVIENRQAYFERQLQQQQNGQIGRMQVSETFSNSAPSVQAAPVPAPY